ncbi:MAG: hypothetical protein KFW21_04680 [Spirochaetota bacterium]|nr:hypothetical protein [Spirochaetota bacterium]
MKKMLILLTLITSPLTGQEEKNFLYINHSLKLYAALGLPTGIGFLYAPEIRSSIDDNVLHVLNFDLKWLGIERTGNLSGGSFNKQISVGFASSFQYSVGSILSDGSRFYIDLIGVGYQSGLIDTGSFVSIYLLGYQNTLFNGFYWGIRTKMNLIRDPNQQLIVGFGGYIAMGYDFGKKLNPKDYDSRMK